MNLVQVTIRGRKQRQYASWQEAMERLRWYVILCQVEKEFESWLSL
jgi:hypothetical protein